MRMKVRPDLHYAPVPGGVYFGGARTQFVMRGWDLLFKVADVCVPLLEGGATEDELVTALGSEEARPAVRHIVTGLRGHGMMLDLERLTVGEPAEDVRLRHAEAIALLESLSDDPYAAFATVHEAKVVLVGPPDVTGPASRGLARAGVAQVVEATAAEAQAHADAAALLWCDDGEPPAGLPVAPVLLGEQLTLAGPVLRHPAEYPVWQAFRARALSWAAAEGLEPAARPVADALAGALAGQLLFETLAGVARAGEAYVVHGGELVAERVTAGLAARPAPAVHRLEEVEPYPVPTPEQAVDCAAVATQQWTGLFASAPGDTLPQLPVALREIESRTGGFGTVVAAAADQRSATVAVALEALRRLGSGAAGLTEETWLLDGALRLLVTDARSAGVVEVAEMGPETARLRGFFPASGPASLVVRVLRVPGIDWPLVRIESATTGEIQGSAWASDTDAAAGAALAVAVARTQVRRVRDDEFAVGPVNTDALLSTAGPDLALLREQVVASAAARGFAYRGRSHRVDAVLGELPLWYGPVERERADER